MTITFSEASFMQLWNKSRIWCSLRQEGDLGGCGWKLTARDLWRMAAARAARAWARSSWSSLEPTKKGLVGDCIRADMGTLFLWAMVGLGLKVSAIEMWDSCNCLVTENKLSTFPPFSELWIQWFCDKRMMIGWPI